MAHVPHMGTGYGTGNATVEEEMSGKGSAPRPYSVPMEEFDKSFERIFGAKKSEAMDSAAGSGLPASETENRDGEVSQPAGLPETVQD